MANRRLRHLMLIGVIAVATAGCHKQVNDAEIAKDINDKVAADPQANQSQVVVASNEGNVSLQGKARTQDAKARAEQIANQEPGVKSVDDQIAVDPNFDGSANSTPSAGMASSAPAHAAAPAPQAAASAPPPPPPAPIIVPSGTMLTIRLGQTIESKTATAGSVFSGSMANPVTVHGVVAIPDGSPVSGVVSDAKKAGKFKGAATLSLTLTSVTIKGHPYNIEAESVSQTTTGKGKRTAGVIAGGTGVGAAIGGLAGGGKGAAIGALVGAGAGTVGAATTGNNRDITYAVESALSFRLAQPLTLKPE
ncbi:BON domain-containing protein [Occallatibacter riparius]|uniref:BON domain-containing protein n=1 Tax=Occallatibacter riparius TaxID=1002689 RepID=A0A9J7BXU6_9BACT|nr:BON domain-containing protein [Occallatibacter riparius]UWZ86085.1 BON domain-containing protein [Occallatibacter riparius]